MLTLARRKGVGALGGGVPAARTRDKPGPRSPRPTHERATRLSWLSCREPRREAALRTRRRAGWLGCPPNHEGPTAIGEAQGTVMGKPAPNLNRAARELPKPARNCCDLRTSPRVGDPLTREPRPPPAPPPRARPPPRAGVGSKGPREPSASLPRPRWREGGSGEGATQTVALGKLRRQFFQVCLSEWRGVGARLGDLPSPAAAPEGPGLPGRSGPGQRRRGREGAGAERGREGKRALPRVHTMRQPRRSPSPAGALAARHGGAAAGKAPTESEHQQLSNRAEADGFRSPGAAEGCSLPGPRARALTCDLLVGDVRQAESLGTVRLANLAAAPSLHIRPGREGQQQPGEGKNHSPDPRRHGATCKSSSVNPRTRALFTLPL